MRYTDPNGHKACDNRNDEQMCSPNNEFTSKDYQEALRYQYGWVVKGDWTLEELDTLYSAGTAISAYIDSFGGKGDAWVKRYIGNAVFHKAPFVERFAQGMVPWKNDVLLPDGFDSQTALHEVAHVFDNNSRPNGWLPATYVGGGIADAMVGSMGGRPEQCVPRFSCNGDNNYAINLSGDYSWPVENNIANNGSADDFAETFANSVLGLPVPFMRQWWLDNILLATTLG